MKRDFAQLENGPFELLVIGGGVYGAWAAYDAASRGMKVAVVEKNDWASATSSASSKLIHGGIRYLERLQVGLVRKSLDERRQLSRMAPHRVHPLRFVLPVYRDARVGRLRLRIGLWLYDRLAGADQPVAPHRSYGRDDLLARWKHLEPEGLQGGFTYGDCGTDDARMVIEVVDGALDAGAVAVNRACATELLVEDERVVGAKIHDVERDEAIDVRASAVLNCAGPWGAEIVHRSRPAAVPAVRRTKGVHLVMPSLETDDGILLLSNDDGRVVFLIPWEGRTLLGTTDTDHEGDPDLARVEDADVDYLLARANGVLSGAPWNRRDVIGAFAGLRTLAAGGDSPSSVSRELTVTEPIPGLLTPIGGKYTSSRVDAAGIVDRVARQVGQGWLPRHEADRLPWTPDGDYNVWRRDTLGRGFELGLDEPTIAACQRRYGRKIDMLYAVLEDHPEWTRPFVPDAPVCVGELIHVARHEMARSLTDVLRRRIPLVLISRLAGDAILRAAAVVGAELGWSDERRAREAERVSKLRFEHAEA